MIWKLSPKPKTQELESDPFNLFKLEKFLTARDRDAIISSLEWQLAELHAQLKAQAQKQAMQKERFDQLLLQLNAVVDANALLRAKLWHKKRPRGSTPEPMFNNPLWDEPQNP
jgi:hypothetical protein